jgi:hypothetical protein
VYSATRGRAPISRRLPSGAGRPDPLQRLFWWQNRKNRPAEGRATLIAPRGSGSRPRRPRPSSARARRIGGPRIGPLGPWWLLHRTRRIDDGNPAARLSGRCRGHHSAASRKASARLSGRGAAHGQLVEIDRHQASQNGRAQASDHPEIDGPRPGHFLGVLVADQRDDALGGGDTDRPVPRYPAPD